MGTCKSKLYKKRDYDAVRCNKCQQISTRPHSAKCQHVYCETCTPARCCGHRKFRRNVFVENIIREIEFACPHCNEITSNASYDIHVCTPKLKTCLICSEKVCSTKFHSHTCVQKYADAKDAKYYSLIFK